MGYKGQLVMTTYLKDEIIAFLNNIKEAYNIDKCENDFLIFISKKIIFLKIIKNSLNDQDDAKFYVDQLISDLMYLIDSYLNGNLRYTQLNIRSMIEGVARIFNGVSVRTKQLTMTTLLDNINRYIQNNEVVDGKGKKLKYEDVKSLYSESCLFVHGNVNAHYSLVEFFNELGKIKISSRRKKVLMEKIERLVNLLINISSYRFATDLNDIFFKEKFELKYLIGEDNVKVIKNFSSVIVTQIDESGLKIGTVIFTKKIGTLVENINPVKETYLLVSCSRLDSLEYEDETKHLTCTYRKKDF